MFKACAENPTLVSVMGVNPEYVRGMTWFIAGGVTALAGSLLPLWTKGYVGTVAQYMIVAIMAGSFLGGIDSPLNSLMAGFVVEFLEIKLVTWGQEYIGVWVGEYQPIFSLLILVFALFFRQKSLRRNYNPEIFH